MQRTKSALLLCIIVGTMLLSSAGWAMERPFILWNKGDIATIRKKIETEAWAKAACEKLLKNPERHESSFSNLFGHAVMGEKEAAELVDKAIANALSSGKIKDLAAGKMGLSTTEVGDLVAGLIGR